MGSAHPNQGGGFLGLRKLIRVSLPNSISRSGRAAKSRGGFLGLGLEGGGFLGLYGLMIEATYTALGLSKTPELFRVNRGAPTSSDLLALGGHRFDTHQVGRGSPHFFLTQNLSKLMGWNHQTRNRSTQIVAISIGDFFWL